MHAHYRHYIQFLLKEESYLNTIKQGFWYFAEKKAKFRGIFRGKFAEKSADFAGFSREKSQNSRNNRPISVDFRRRKVKIRRKIGRFHGKFRGETSPRNNQ